MFSFFWWDGPFSYFGLQSLCHLGPQHFLSDPQPFTCDHILLTPPPKPPQGWAFGVVVKMLLRINTLHNTGPGWSRFQLQFLLKHTLGGNKYLGSNDPSRRTESQTLYLTSYSEIKRQFCSVGIWVRCLACTFWENIFCCSKPPELMVFCYRALQNEYSRHPKGWHIIILTALLTVSLLLLYTCRTGTYQFWLFTPKCHVHCLLVLIGKICQEIYWK